MIDFVNDSVELIVSSLSNFYYSNYRHGDSKNCFIENKNGRRKLTPAHPINVLKINFYNCFCRHAHISSPFVKIIYAITLF